MSTKAKKKTTEVERVLEVEGLSREDQAELNLQLQVVRGHMRRLESHSSELHGLRSGPQEFLLNNLEGVQKACHGAIGDAGKLLHAINTLHYKLGRAKVVAPKPKGRKRKAA